MREEKKERKKERRKRKSKFSRSIFLTVIRINVILGVYFTLEQLRVFSSKHFTLLWCVYLGAATIP